MNPRLRKCLYRARSRSNDTGNRTTYIFRICRRNRVSPPRTADYDGGFRREAADKVYREAEIIVRAAGLLFS